MGNTVKPISLVNKIFYYLQKQYYIEKKKIIKKQKEKIQKLDKNKNIDGKHTQIKKKRKKLNSITLLPHNQSLALTN